MARQVGKTLQQQNNAPFDNSSFLDEVKAAPSLIPEGTDISGMRPQPSEVDLSQFYDVLGSTFDPTGDLYRQAAEEQSTGAKLLGTLNKALMGEIVGGTIEGIGHLLDLDQTVKALEGETQEWGNWLTDIGQSMRTWAEEATPVYTDPSIQGQFAPWKADWWYENAPSMASTFSLMIPAAGAVRGASLLARGLNLSGKLGKGAKFAVKGVGQAIASRLMENGMEAIGNYDETFNKWVDQVGEEEAKRLASESASGTWKANWAMLAQDIPQYLMLNKAFGKAAEDMTSGVAKAMGQSGLVPTLKAGQAIALDALGEGFEEGYQFIASEESRHLAEVRAGLRDPSEFGERLNKYLRDGEMQSAMLIGAIGGAAMQTAGKPVNRAIANLKGEKTVDQKRVENIQSWAAERQKLSDDVKKFEAAGDVLRAREAKKNLTTTMGIQAAELGNLGALRETFKAIKSEADPAALERLGVTQEELPEFKKNADSYIEQLNKIETLYDNYKKSNVHDQLVPLVVQMQATLDNKKELKSELDKELKDTLKTVAGYKDLSTNGKDLLQLAAIKKQLSSAIKSAEKGITSQKKQLDELSKKIESESNEDIKGRLQKQYDNLDRNIFFSETVLAEQQGMVEKLDNKISETKETYSTEDKESDKKLNITEKDYINYTSKVAEQTQVNKEIEMQQKYLNEYKSDKFNKKFAEELRKKSVKSIREALMNASSIEEIEEVEAEAQGNTEAETAVKEGIDEKAASETPNYYYRRPGSPEELERQYFEEQDRAERQLPKLIGRMSLETFSDFYQSEVAKSEEIISNAKKYLADRLNATEEERKAIGAILRREQTRLRILDNALVEKTANEVDTAAAELTEKTQTTITTESAEAVEEVFLSNFVELEDGNGLTFTIRGKHYSNTYSDPTAAINRDNEGNIVSITLHNEKMQPITFRQERIVDEVAYYILLNEAAKNQPTTAEVDYEEVNRRIQESQIALAERDLQRLQDLLEEGLAAKNELEAFSKGLEQTYLEAGFTMKDIVADPEYKQAKQSLREVKKAITQLRNDIKKQGAKVEEVNKPLTTPEPILKPQDERETTETAEQVAQAVTTPVTGQESQGEVSDTTRVSQPVKEPVKLSEIYEGSVANLLKDRRNLGNKFIEPQNQSILLLREVNDLLNINNLQELDTIIASIYEQANNGDPEYIKARDIIDNYYANKGEQQFSELGKQSTTQELADNPQGTVQEEVDLEVLSIPEQERYPFDATVKEMMFEFNEELKKWIVVYDPKTGKPIPNTSFLLEDKDFNHDTINQPGEFLEGTKVWYEVPMEGPYSIANKNSGDFQIEVVTYKNGKRIVLTVLTDVVKANDENYPEQFDKLVELRERIYQQAKDSKQATGVFKTGLYTTISAKHAGRIWRTKKDYHNPHEIVKGTNQPIVFGIVTDKGGGKILDVPNAPSDDYKSPMTSVEDKPLGAVYMLLPASNGQIIPMRVFTRKISEFNQKDGTNIYKRKIFKLLTGLEFGKEDVFKSTLKDIQKIAYLKLELKKDTITVYDRKNNPVTLNRELLTSQDPATIEQLSKVLDDMILQVDINSINREDPETSKSYNETISKEGRVKLNVNPGRWTHSTRFTLDPNYQTGEHPKAVNKSGSKAPKPPVNNENELVFDSTPDASTDDKAMIDGTANLEDSTGLGDALFGPTKPKSDKPETKPANKFLKNKRSDKPSLFRLASGEAYELWDEAKETAWFKKNFPNVELEVLEGLLEVNKNGGINAWGAFSNAMVYISNQAKVGTTYHEAFHVVFNMFLTPQQRADILEQAKVEYGNLSDLSLEEKLADEFSDYVMSEEKIQPTWSQKVVNFFKRLYSVIKYKLTGKQTIEELFYRANTGYYSGKKFTRDVSNFSNITRWSIEGFTAEQQDFRTTNIADAIRRVLNELSNLPENLNKNRRQVVYEYGLDNIAKEAFTRLNDHLIDQNEAGNYGEEQLNTFGKMLEHFIYTDENGEFPEGKVTYGKLGEVALRKLAQSEGLRLKVGSTWGTKNNTSDPENTQLDEEEIKLEGWQVQVLETAASDRATGRMRSEISHIEQLGPNKRVAVDDLGLPKYLDFKTSFATIIKELSDAYTVKDMLKKLDELVELKPEYAGFSAKVKSDSSLRTLLWTAFQNSHADYRVLISETDDKTGKPVFKWITANRQGLTLAIVEQWKNNYYSIGSAITDEQSLYTNFDKKVGRVTKFTEANLKDLEALLFSVGIDVTLEELTALNDVKSGNKDTKATKFYKAIKPVLNKYFNEQDPYEGQYAEPTSLRVAANYIKSTREDLQESSYRNVENKTVYSHIISNFISKQTTELLTDENLREAYLSTPFYSKMPWLNRMHTGNKEFYQENFKYAILDGKKLEGEFRGTKYTELTDVDLDIVRINAFLNNNNSSAAFYQMPTLADAPNSVFMQAEKFSDEAVVEQMYWVAVSEWERIKQVESLEKKYKAFNSNGKYFILIKALNNNKDLFRDGYEANKDAIKDVIRTYLNKEYAKEKAQLVESGVVEQTNEGTLSSDNISTQHGYDNIDKLLQNYFFNAVLANTQMIALYQGDPAFYKGTKDFFKRAKEVWSPGTLLDLSAEFILTEEQAALEGTNRLAVKDYYKTVYIEDEEYYSTKMDEDGKSVSGLGVDILNILLDKNEVPDIVAYQIASNYGYSNFKDENGRLFAKIGKHMYPTKKTNVTDAQGFISLDRYREVQVGLGRWTKEYQDAFHDIKAGKNTDQTTNMVFNPVKPFVFTHKFDGNLVVPTQNKNSEYLLLPSVAYVNQNGEVVNPTKADRENGYKNFKSPKLASILDTMQRDSFDDTDKIDSVQFNSAVKAGESGAVTLDKITDAELHILDNADYRLQQETPDHFTDDKGIIGTQGRKLIIGDISKGAVFTLPDGTTLEAEDLIMKYHNIVSFDVKEAFDTVAKRFAYQEGDATSYNEAIDSIQDLLLEEVRSRNMGEAMEEALGTYMGKDGFKRFNLPLFHPLHSMRTESLIGSIYKNKVVKQKAPGGNMVQVSSIGFSEDLQIVTGNDNVEYYECYMPWWSQRYFKELQDADGNIDINKLPNELKDALGYRIPTEDKYSMTPLRIKGFLPRHSGGSIMLPAEITTVTGSDFDIDKMYIMLPAFRTKRFNKGDFRKRLRAYAKANPAEFADTDLSTDNLNIVMDQIEAEQPLNEEDLSIYDFMVEQYQGPILETDIESQDLTDIEFSEEDMKSAEEIMKHCKSITKTLR